MRDEPEHERLRRLLLEGDEDVLTTALSRVELGGAVARAESAGRLQDRRVVLERFDVDSSRNGPLTLLALGAETPLERAYELAVDRRLRAFDAFHLAIALQERVEAFVTCDARQAAAAEALGLAVQ
jgi:predicted nucleic acid-binding protein